MFTDQASEYFKNGLDPSRIFLNDRADQLATILCKLCNKILINPKYCQNCKRDYCKKCLEELKKDNINCICNKKVAYDPEPSSEIISALSTTGKYSCIYNPNSCNVNSFYENLMAHELTCQKQIIICPSKGCNEKIILENRESHLMACNYFILKCEHCQQDMIRKTYKKHVDNCSFKNLICDGCNKSFFLKDFQAHYVTCEDVETECRICHKNFSRKNLEHHTENYCLENKVLEFSEQATEEISKLKFCLLYLNKRLKEQTDLFFQRCKYCKKETCESSRQNCTECRDIVCIQDCLNSHMKLCSVCKCLYCLNCAGNVFATTLVKRSTLTCKYCVST